MPGDSRSSPRSAGAGPGPGGRRFRPGLRRERAGFGCFPPVLRRNRPGKRRDAHRVRRFDGRSACLGPRLGRSGPLLGPTIPGRVRSGPGVGPPVPVVGLTVPVVGPPAPVVGPPVPVVGRTALVVGRTAPGVGRNGPSVGQKLPGSYASGASEAPEPNRATTLTRDFPAAAPRARCGCPRGPRSTRTCRTHNPRAWDRSRPLPPRDG